MIIIIMKSSQNISSFPQHCPAVFLQMIPLSSSPLTMRTSFGSRKDAGQTDAFCDLFQDVLLESFFFFECREGRISRVALKTATKNFRFPLDVQLSLYMYPNPMNNKIKHVYGWKKNKP